MANSKQAVKRHRQNLIRRDRNRSYRSTMRTAIKKIRTAIEAKDSEAAQGLLEETVKIIDSTAQKGVIHRNTAARYKSRLAGALRALEA